MLVDPRQPSTIPPDSERIWAILIHLAAFLDFTGLLFADIIAQLAIWLVFRRRSELLDRHGKAALNFNISFTLYAMISFALIFVGIGVVTTPVIVIAYIIFVIRAAVRASNRQDPNYPLAIKFIQ